MYILLLSIYHTHTGRRQKTNLWESIEKGFAASFDNMNMNGSASGRNGMTGTTSTTSSAFANPAGGVKSGELRSISDISIDPSMLTVLDPNDLEAAMLDFNDSIDLTAAAASEELGFGDDINVAGRISSFALILEKIKSVTYVGGIYI